ncbi:hypothetical protein ACTXT7_009340 [Hymenolepis weldensis]
MAMLTTPPKTEKTGFVRNSSIRLSDTRARRGMREPTNLESEKPKETSQIEVPATQTVETTASKAPEPLKEEKNGFIRNSSIRLSDTRSRRNARENKSLTDSSKETEASAPIITPIVKPVEATPFKAPEPTKPGSSGFTRNSSIRLSDTRARRGIRENNSDAFKEVPVAGAATAAVTETNSSETYESLRPKNGGFIRNSSIRLSDTRARRSMRETKPSPSETTIELNTNLDYSETDFKKNVADVWDRNWIVGKTKDPQCCPTIICIVKSVGLFQSKKQQAVMFFSYSYIKNFIDWGCRLSKVIASPFVRVYMDYFYMKPNGSAIK